MFLPFYTLWFSAGVLGPTPGAHIRINSTFLYLVIFSWGSGANPWGPEKEDQFSKPTHYDGNLEVVGITGVVHMAQIHSGLRNGIRVAQGGHVSGCFHVVR